MAKAKIATKVVRGKKVVNVFVGEFDKPLQKVAMNVTDTVGDAIRKAGYVVADGMDVKNKSATPVALDAKVVENEDYFVTTRHESGNEEEPEANANDDED